MPTAERAEGPLIDEPQTDAEVVEFTRREMQAIMDRSDFSAPTHQGLLDSVGLPHSEVQLFEADLTELGKFDLDLPTEITHGVPKLIIDAMRRHWVYRQKDGKVISLQLRQRLLLRARGYVVAHAFINNPGERN